MWIKDWTAALRLNLILKCKVESITTIKVRNYQYILKCSTAEHTLKKNYYNNMVATVKKHNSYSMETQKVRVWHQKCYGETGQIHFYWWVLKLKNIEYTSDKIILLSF